MRTLLAVSVLVFALGCARGARPDAAPSMQLGEGTVYSAPTGEAVTVIPVLPLESRKFLLHFQVPGDGIDGKVHLITTDNKAQEFYTRWRGKSVRVFMAAVTLRGRVDHYRLIPPGGTNVVVVSPDPARTQALKPGEVQALYLKQQADGTYLRDTAPDLKFWSDLEDRQLAVTEKALNDACGSTVAARIDWDTLSQELRDEYGASAYCREPLERLQALCTRSEEARRTVQAKVKSLRCRVGEAYTPRVEGDTVVWTFNPKVSSPQPDTVTQFFMDNL